MLLQGWRPHTPLGLPASPCPPSRHQRSLHLLLPPSQSTTHTSNQEVMVSICLGGNHNGLIQRNWLLTQAVLKLLFEFVGSSLFRVIQIKKNVKVSLTLSLASYPPERCRAGGVYGDRSCLFLLESRCPLSKTDTFWGVLLIWSLLVCVDPRSRSLNNLFQYWFFHPSTMGILYKCGTELWDCGYNWDGRTSVSQNRSRSASSPAWLFDSVLLLFFSLFYGTLLNIK